jgi:hypothetical protein
MLLFLYRNYIYYLFFFFTLNLKQKLNSDHLKIKYFPATLTTSLTQKYICYYYKKLYIGKYKFSINRMFLRLVVWDSYIQ